jgi:hypothetical protein
MKKIVIAMMSMAFLLRALPVFSAEDAAKTQWYPFVLSEKLDPDSPANVGKFVLDAPAGKHGFVKVKGNQFVFEDGTPARFWGTNLCFSACFPSKEQARMMADRLAFFGFNAVRLHHMDFFFEPDGIFEDVRRATDNRQLKKTGVLSPRQLDKLDYLIYLLKERGIYIDMNLLVARHFTVADGVVDADKLGMAAKPVSLFDPVLIELQKKYAKDLLTHFNPYTNLRYCDDPAVALVEITNENSIFDYWKWNRLNGPMAGFKRDSIPEKYVKQLDDKWSKWLKDKYSDSGRSRRPRPTYKFEKINSSDDMADIASFYTDLEKEYFDGMLAFLKNEAGVKVPVTGMGGYTCNNDVNAQINCDFIDRHAYWDHPHFPNSGWDRDNFRIHGKSMLKDKKLGMVSDLRKNPAPEKPRTMTEWNHCYPNQRSYETPVLMAIEAVKSKCDGLFQFAYKHSLPDEYRPDNIDSYFDIIASPQQLILMSVAGLVYLRDAAFNHSIEDGVFKLNSEKMAGAAGYIKDKTISLDYLKIISKQDGAVFIYSADDNPVNMSCKLVLVAVCGVKNKDSGWINNKFKWGSPPTLLSNMDAEIELLTDKGHKAYELTADGGRGKEIISKFHNGILTVNTNGSDSPWFEISSE